MQMHLKNGRSMARVHLPYKKVLAWLGATLCLLTCACSPEERDPLVSAGMYAFAQERYSEAIVAFHKALSSRADDCEVHHYLARSYLALGKFPQALRAIEHAIELAPKKTRRAPSYTKSSASSTRPATPPERIAKTNTAMSKQRGRPLGKRPHSILTEQRRTTTWAYCTAIAKK